LDREFSSQESQELNRVSIVVVVGREMQVVEEIISLRI